MTLNLNSEQLQSYIGSHELDLRAGSVHGVSAETIFRYGGFVGSNIQSFSSLDRTMNYCRSQIDQLEKKDRAVVSGTVVLADKLISSKGRFRRIWHAPEGGLWGCMILVNTFLAETINLLPLALGVSCCEAMREAGAAGSAVRWVNDVLIDNKKAAGFLIEGYRTVPGLEQYSLIGFGINVNNDIFPKELGTTAISLKQALGRRIDHNRFCLSYLAKLSWNIGLICYEEQQKLLTGNHSGCNSDHLLLEKWKQLSDSRGQRVLYGYEVIGKPQYQATVTGIRNDGGLVMSLDDGRVIVEHSGEIRYIRE